MYQKPLTKPMETYFSIQEAYENMTDEERSEFLARQVNDRIREIQEDERDRERA